MLYNIYIIPNRIYIALILILLLIVIVIIVLFLYKDKLNNINGKKIHPLIVEKNNQVIIIKIKTVIRA